MAKLSSNDAQFIRNVFKRERQSAELAISNKDLARNSVGGGVFGSAIDSSVNGVMGDILSLDRRMLYRYRDYEEMDEYGDISCLSGDSLVFTLEWGWRRIDNLAEHGGQFYVLSYDKERRSIVPAKCDGARMTGQRGHVKRMVRVVLDNGTSIRCTADHLFMLKDGGWTRADGLRFQDRVMSCVIGLGQSISKNTLLPESGNNRVVAVEQLDITEDVYDLSVPKYRNFVCNGVVVHNSALDIYSDDATQVDGVTGKSVWVETDDGKVKDELTDLFDKRLRIEEKIWEITRTLCKYGNDLEEIVVGDNGVVGLNYLAVPTMRRVENKRGDLIGFMQTYSRDTDISPEEFEKMRISTGGAIGPQKDVAVFEDWRVSHMRLTSKYRDSLYGWAVTDAARWIWKRLMLLEDAVLVYKLTRSPSRYAFYVDIGKLGKAEGERALQETMQRLKKRKFVNPKTGKLDLRFSPLSMDEDFFLAMREGRESTRVESLMGPSYQQVDDVQYFLYKLYAALKVPRAYMGYDENMPSKATLSQEDVRFARTILRVQREVRNGLRKVAKVDLAARKIDPDAVDFDVKMTVPSSIFELGQMEVRRARADLASMMERHVSQYWLLKNIYGMSEDDIQELTKQKKDENKMANEMGGTGGGRYEDVIVPTGGRRGFVGYGRPGMISERELFDGNREHERQVEERIRKAINDPNSHVGKQLRETGHLLREILFTVRRVA